jgi:hypothetical protein
MKQGWFPDSEGGKGMLAMNHSPGPGYGPFFLLTELYAAAMAFDWRLCQSVYFLGCRYQYLLHRRGTQLNENLLRIWRSPLLFK